MATKINGTYDYAQSVKDDLCNWIVENANRIKDEVKNGNIEDYYSLLTWIYDETFCDDSVTGNASGSYTCNAWEAEENICHNLELLGEALQEFGSDANYITEKGAEACDVTIRCYVLSDCINELLAPYESMKFNTKLITLISNDIEL